MFPTSSESASSVPARGFGLRFACVAVVVLGIFFRFYHLDGKVFWEDEIAGKVRALGYTEASIVEAAPNVRDARGLQAYFHLPQADAKPERLVDTVRALASEDPQHPPLYYVASRLWMERFGSSVAATRSLAAVFGVLALPCAFWLALELFGSATVAFVAVALLAVSPFQVLYAQEAREYSLWSVAILLCCATFLRARRKMTVSAWCIYGATLALGLYVFPLTGLVAMGQGVFLLTLDPKRSAAALVAYGAACAAAAIAFAPWLWIMLTNQAVERGMGHILTTKISAPLVVRIFAKGVRQIFVDYSGDGGFVVNTLLTLITTALAAYALIFLARRGPRTASGFVLCALCAPALPLLVHDLLWHGTLVYQSRYFMPFYLGIELGVAFLLASKMRERAGGRTERAVWRAGFAGVLACGIVSCAVSSQADTWWNKDYEQSRTIAGVVNESAAPLVVAEGGASRTLGLGYYLDPRVRLKLNLSCDNCDQRTLVAETRAPEVSGHERFSDVFVLGGGNGIAGKPVRRIDVEVYAAARGPLSLFARP